MNEEKVNHDDKNYFGFTLPPDETKKGFRIGLTLYVLSFLLNPILFFVAKNLVQFFVDAGYHWAWNLESHLNYRNPWLLCFFATNCIYWLPIVAFLIRAKRPKMARGLILTSLGLFLLSAFGLIGTILFLTYVFPGPMHF
jgi:hypothetical protein